MVILTSLQLAVVRVLPVIFTSDLNDLEYCIESLGTFLLTS